MLELRISAPPDLAAAALDVLTRDPAVSEIAVHRGASVKPLGDVVVAYVAREAANDVVDRVRALGVPEVGSVQVTPVQTWMSRAGLAAEAVSPGSSADSVVWSEVTQSAYAETEPNWTFHSLIALATMLAGVAIVLDSQILVIGAMVIGPEFGAISALGLALVRKRPALLSRALRVLLSGFAVGIALTTLAALGGRALGWITLDDVIGPRPATGFIYTPDKWSFIVALIAAAAGVLALTSSRVSGLSGVFISVTTIPAAANIALGIAFWQPHEILGSTAQLLLNLSGMALAGWATMLVQQVVWHRVSEHRARVLARRHPR